MRLQRIASSAVLLVLMVAAGRLPPVPAAPNPARSLEQQLFEDLDTNPLKPGVPRQPSTPAPQQKQGQRPSGEGLQEQLSRELGAASVSEDIDLILDIVQQMQQAQSLIEQAKTGETTQQVQAGILALLDELLKTAQGQPQMSKATQSHAKEDAPRRTPNRTEPKPNDKGKPSAKAPKPGQARPGVPGSHRPNMAEMNELLKNVWGELPEHQREQMLELPIEEFLPKYELLIESYFKRLAEEQGRE